MKRFDPTDVDDQFKIAESLIEDVDKVILLHRHERFVNHNREFKVVIIKQKAEQKEVGE